MKFKMKTKIEITDLDKWAKESIEKSLKSTTQYMRKSFIKEYLSGILSLQELRYLDHPYAKRHYQIRAFASSNLRAIVAALAALKFSGVRLDEINRQTGLLARSVKYDDTIQYTGNKAITKIYLDTQKCPHAEYVFFGTNKMIPRPLHLLYCIIHKEEIEKYFNRKIRYYMRKYKNKLKKEVRT